MLFVPRDVGTNHGTTNPEALSTVGSDLLPLKAGIRDPHC